jgi:hypothetical protein
MMVNAAITNGKKRPRRFPGKTRPDEQAGQKEEHRHEEAVGGEHDAVEAEPEFWIGMTEIGVGDHRVVNEHDKGEEGARSVDREIAFGGL